MLHLVELKFLYCAPNRVGITSLSHMRLEAQPIRSCKAIKRLEVLDWLRQLVP